MAINMYIRVQPWVLFLVRAVQLVFALGTLIPVAINAAGMEPYDFYEEIVRMRTSSYGRIQSK